jgi:hypothetical protein
MNIKTDGIVRAASFALMSILLAVPAANAAEGGYGNYVPGTYGDFAMAVAPTGELTLRQDLYYYNADTSRAVRSGRLEVGADLTFLASYSSLFYKPSIELFGAQYVMGVFVPFMDVEIESTLSDDASTAKSKADAASLGDIAWIPAALFWNRGNFYYSLSETIVSPTGDYDVKDPINVGLNVWSFDTNFAMTYLNGETGKDFSFNLGHMYNTENDDTDYQSGQVIHLDVALNQFLSETFAVGLLGFHLDQITGDSGSGALLGDFKSEATGVGLSSLWGTKVGAQDVSFIAKWLHEVDAENRIEGDHVYVSLAMDW